ncbi:hypothetical protein BUALT_Bualt14G0014400 [Buddleja alternifolia]|uniref:Fungal lipase-type domain-containing protein n=1 Tax=Buddleja alternifolia TaxID=168488 RepID=A0AAV6WHA3_9LAMI|nr:hypothetical protein BUALT_Bualt14G0014400 [Buddleja alternifolia]
MPTRLASVWRDIQGLNNWENLVEPLNPLLQGEIIRYGEFVMACYKAFEFDPESKRWIGYVAVSGDKEVSKLGRRDIVITFRGTVTNPEWIANLMSSLKPARFDPHHARTDVKVEEGFLSLYTLNESANKFGLGSCREQLLCEVSRLLNKYKGEEISITLAGHSMGSSLAHLLAYDIAELGLNRVNGCWKDIPVTVFSFGGPRVGNLGFKERCEELGVKVLRVVNVNDPIVKLPGVVFNEKFRVFNELYWFAEMSQEFEECA